MHWLLRFFICTTLLVGPSRLSLHAQRDAAVVRVPDAPACVACAISVRTEVSLPLPPAPSDGYPAAVRIDAKGRYWVFRRDEMPAVFSSQGELVRTLGRRGKGPGEFIEAYDVLFFNPDSFLVLDGLGARATVLDAQLRPVRYITPPFVMRSPVIASWPSSVIGSGAIRTAAKAGLPMHLVSFAGKQPVTVRSFGPGDGEMRPEQVLTMWYSLTTPNERTFWSAPRHGYDLFEWSTGGTLLRTLLRRPPWFSKPSRPWIGNPETPPPPFVHAIELDDDGLIWVFVHIPAAKWRDAWPNLPKRTREVPARLIPIERMFATMVEVVDPQAGRVVVRRQLDAFVVGAMPGRRGAIYEVDDNGNSHISIVAFDLTGR